MSRSKTRTIFIWLGAIVLIVFGLVLTKANFYLMPFARITEGGRPVRGYAHRNSRRTRMIITRSELGRRKSYLIGLDDSHGGLFAANCDDWTAPHFPAFLFPHVNPPCVKFHVADESPAPSEPKRDVKMENSAVEFTADDGKRVRLSW